MKSINNRYDISKTFEYNKKNGPFEEIKDRNNEIKKILGNYGIEVDFFGFKTKLPIGVAAGSLYSKKYMEGAAKDGFEVITWKTFRSVNRLAHVSNGNFLGHNIVFLPNKSISVNDANKRIVASKEFSDKVENISITNSFGMPSDTPDKWLSDVVDLENYAKKNHKLVITSVVGTPKINGTIDDLANDYAFLARAAESAGATVIELNLSCPNVCGAEGTIFKDVENSKIIVKKTKKMLYNSGTKLLIKVGYSDKKHYKNLLESTFMYINGIVAINTVPMYIVDTNNKQALPGGETSGTCGKAILDMSVEAVLNLYNARKELNLKKNIKIIGCGGVTEPCGFMRHLDAGAEFVMCATAALFNPELPMNIAKYIKKEKIKRSI